MKLSRKFLVTMMTLLLTAVALGTATYAWFVMNTTVEINNVGGQVKTIDDLLAQEGDASAALLEGDWLGELDGVQTVVFEDITSKDGKTFTWGENEAHKSDDPETTPTKNQDYYEYVFTLRNPQAVNVKLEITEKSVETLGAERLSVTIGEGTTIFAETAARTFKAQDAPKDYVETVAYDTGISSFALLLDEDTNYYYAVVTIRVWIEGWDDKTTNAILGLDSLFTLIFSKV